MAYKSIKEAVETELGWHIEWRLNKLVEALEKEYGHIHFTALDVRKYKRHTNGLVKVLIMAITRARYIP